MTDMTVATDDRTYGVDPVASLKAALGWLRNPVSINGPRNLRRLNFASGGPKHQKMVAEMRRHPDGARILAERPDLASALSDMDALAAMPDGSLGRAYHDFMSHPAAVPTYLLGSLFYENGEFDALDWSEDMKYLASRLNYTHDLTHAISGYSTHLASEAINILFSTGLEGGDRRAARFLTGLFGLISIPRVGWKRWRDECMRAYERGVSLRETIPFHCVYWEELLAQPLDEVRARLGVEPLAEPLDTTDWILNPLGNAMANGYGQAGDREGKAQYKALAETLGGFRADPRDFAAIVNLPTETAAELYEAFEQGADEAELRRIAGLAPRTLAA